jgi:hypothetical protein
MLMTILLLFFLFDVNKKDCHVKIKETSHFFSISMSMWYYRLLFFLEKNNKEAQCEASY